jgi:hypothetical protein
LYSASHRHRRVLLCIIRQDHICIIPMVIIITGMHTTGIIIMSIIIITATIVFIIIMEDRIITGIRILIGQFNA